MESSLKSLTQEVRRNIDTVNRHLADMDKAFTSAAEAMNTVLSSLSNLDLAAEEHDKKKNEVQTVLHLSEGHRELSPELLTLRKQTYYKKVLSVLSLTLRPTWIKRRKVVDDNTYSIPESVLIECKSIAYFQPFINDLCIHSDYIRVLVVDGEKVYYFNADNIKDEMAVMGVPE